jgi:hypothetical protein
VKNLKYKIGDKFFDRAGAVREIIHVVPLVGEGGNVYELDSPFDGMNWVSEELIDYNFKPYNQEGNNKKLDKLINGFDETVELEG